MINSYNLFNLGVARMKGVITDEMVEKAYLTKKQQYLEMKNKDNNSMDSVDHIINNEQLIAFKDNDFLELLEDAYYSIRTENARIHYNQLLQMLEEHIEKQKLEKTDKLSVKSKAITSLKERIQSIHKKPENTEELLDKILEEASNKYPIPNCKDSKDEIEI